MGSFIDVTDYGHGGWKVVIVAALLITMQILMVTGRFVSRKMNKVTLAADDYVLLFAAALTSGLCGLALAFPRIAGLGSHSARTQMMTPSEGVLVGQSFIAWMIVYGASIAVSKCAILLPYLRVFTTCKKAFAITAYLVGLVIIATGMANTFIAILKCSPQSFAWDNSIKGGTCIDEIAWTRYMAIPNVVAGAVMLVMPLPVVWRLNISVSAKIALTATFLHGIIGIIASCVRLSILFSTDASHFSNETSLVWTIWTINEPANYIIAASLPTLRPIFIRILPSSFFVLSRKRSSKPYTSSPKISWPGGALAPKFHRDSMNFQINNQITTPRNTNVHEWEADGGEGYWTDIESESYDRGSEQRDLVPGSPNITDEGGHKSVVQPHKVSAGEAF